MQIRSHRTQLVIMENNQPVLDQLFEGYEFKPVTFKVDSLKEKLYMQAIANPLSGGPRSNITPMAAASQALSSLSGQMRVPDGMIHVSQDLEFLKPIQSDQTLTVNARINRRLKRKGITLLGLYLSANNENDEEVLCGQTCFILPETKEEECLS